MRWKGEIKRGKIADEGQQNKNKSQHKKVGNIWGRCCSLICRLSAELVNPSPETIKLFHAILIQNMYLYPNSSTLKLLSH